MNRKCVRYDISGFIKDFNLEVPYPTIHLYVDTEEEKEINEFIKANKKDFAKVLAIILKGTYFKYLYRKEEHGTAAMKFKYVDNTRIYCCEFHPQGSKKIVMVHLLKKKSEGNEKKIKSLMKAMSKYIYKF